MSNDTEELVTDPTLPAVAGALLSSSLAEFERRCRTLLADEQQKPNPDNTLVDTLCNAVRLGREYHAVAFRQGFPRDEVHGVRVALLGDGATDHEFPRALWPIVTLTLVVDHARKLHAAGCRIVAEDDDAATEEAIGEALAAVVRLHDVAKALAGEVSS
jgi:hypothetical protein